MTISKGNIVHVFKCFIVLMCKAWYVQKLVLAPVGHSSTQPEINGWHSYTSLGENHTYVYCI